MRPVRGLAQRVEHDDFHAPNLGDDFVRHFLAVAAIGQPFAPALLEEKTVARRFPVRQGQGSDAQVADFKRAVEHARSRDEVAYRVRAVVERVEKDAAEMLHRGRAGVDGQGLLASDLAEAAAIVHAHDVVRVRVGDEHGVEARDALAEALQAELRRGVHDQPRVRRLDVDGGPGAVVLRVGEEGSGVFLADDRHAVGGASAEENEFERHRARRLPAAGGQVKDGRTCSPRFWETLTAGAAHGGGRSLGVKVETGSSAARFTCLSNHWMVSQRTCSTLSRAS